MEHENFDDVLRENWPDEERTTNLDEPDQEMPSSAQSQAQRQGSGADESPAPPQNMPDPRSDDNAGRPPTSPDVQTSS